MDRSQLIQQAMEQAAPVIAFVRANEAWAGPIVFALAFGESLAFISLFLPFWAMLVGIGALVTMSGLDFWTVWISASLGAALGDWVSYWLGAHFQHRVAGWWPLSRYPTLLPKGEAFFQRWGWIAVVVGRFSGPLRATVPLAAGITRMPLLPFQLANFGSAFLWAGALMLPGTYFGPVPADLNGPTAMDLVSRETLDAISAFMRAHAAWAPAILFGVMALEGFILTTFLFSGTLLVLAAGALIQSGVLDFPSCFLAIFAGFWLGDTINFEVGRRGEGWFRSLGPVRSRPQLMAKAQSLIDRYGVASIAISRFVGPTRPFVTLLAGACHMARQPFHLATAVTTLVLTAGLLNAGMTGMQLWTRMR